MTLPKTESPHRHCVVLLATIAIAFACSNQATDVATAKVDPVGIMLKERGTLPALEVSLEVSPPVNEQVIVQAFAGAVSKARAKCEAAAASLPEVTDALTFKFGVQAGTIQIAEPEGLNDPFAVCMIKALNGNQLSELEKGSHTVLIQVRARRASATKP